MSSTVSPFSSCFFFVCITQVIDTATSALLHSLHPSPLPFHRQTYFFFEGGSGRPSLYRKEKSLALLVHRSYHRLFRGDRDSRNIFSLSLFSANDRPISQKRNSLLHQTERGAAARHVHPIQDNKHTRGYFSRLRRRRRAARTRDAAGMSFCFATFGCLDLGAHSII